jgi:hydroxypyruvate isomerase
MDLSHAQIDEGDLNYEMFYDQNQICHIGLTKDFNGMQGVFDNCIEGEEANGEHSQGCGRDGEDGESPSISG